MSNGNNNNNNKGYKFDLCNNITVIAQHSVSIYFIRTGK